MTETLFIRLGSQANDSIHWLILAGAGSNEAEIIASGELNGAEQLNELTSKAEQRQVQVFVPGSDVLLKRLHVPAKSSRAMRLAVPYMLEDSLADEVEQLFFAYADIANDDEGNNCFTAIVAHNQMQQWQSWLTEAGIKTKSLLPDVLAMPVNQQGWSAIALGDSEQQYMVRQGIWQGSTLDESAWQLQCHLLSAQTSDDETSDNTEKTDIEINAYSPLTESEQLTVTHMPEELPLVLLAQNLNSQIHGFNLFQGQYKVKESRSHASQQWLWVAGVAVFALLLSLGHKSAQLWSLNNEVDNVEQAIITSYKKAFPKTKRVRISTIKSQLNRELALLGGASDQQGFLAMLAQVQPAFAQVPALKPESLKFDGKRQELRIQAQAEDYQAFEKFSRALESADLTVKQGSQSNQGDQVTGSFSISSKTSGKTANKRKSAAKQRSNKNNKETS